MLRVPRCDSDAADFEDHSKLYINSEKPLIQMRTTDFTTAAQLGGGGGGGGGLNGRVYLARC
jgi:hypothetical protein